MPRRSRAHLVLGAALTICTVSSAACAEARVVAGAAPAGPVALAGGSVVYTEERGRSLSLWRSAPRGPRHRIATLLTTSPPGDEFEPNTTDALTDLAASPARVAVGLTRSVTRVSLRAEQVLSAPLGTRPVPMVTTGDGGLLGPPSCGRVVPGTVDVDGDAVAYAAALAGCPEAGEGRSYAIRVRDFAGAEEAREGRIVASTSAPVGGLRMAGRFVAWREPDPLPQGVAAPPFPPRVVVVDRVTGTTVSVLQGPTRSHDVLADGTLVAADGAGSLIVLPPAAEPRTIGAVGAREIRAAAGRAVVARADRELVLVDLDSGRSRPLAGSGQATAFDLDGTQAAWSADGCRATPVLHVVTDLDAATAPARTTCRATLRTRSVGVRRRAVTLVLTCPDGCRGSVRVDVAGRGARRAFDGRGRVRVRVRLDARQLRAVRRSGRRVARVRLRVEQLDDRVTTTWRRIAIRR